MALRGASTTTDTDYIDWMSLAVEGAAVCCTVNSIEEPKDYGQGKPVAVPRAQIIVLTGKQAGTVFPDEMVFKAGIRNKLTEVGDTIVGRMSTYARGKDTHPCLNNEQDGDLDLAKAALAKENGGSVPAQNSGPTSDVDDAPF
jgi:hypothetical protein